MKLIRVDEKAYLEIGETALEIKGYKISSSMHGGTELELMIQLDDSVMKFETSTIQESLQQPNWIAMSDAP